VHSLHRHDVRVLIVGAKVADFELRIGAEELVQCELLTQITLGSASGEPVVEEEAGMLPNQESDEGKSLLGGLVGVTVEHHHAAQLDTMLDAEAYGEFLASGEA